MLCSLSPHPQVEGDLPFTVSEDITDDVCQEMKRFWSLSQREAQRALSHLSE